MFRTALFAFAATVATPVVAEIDRSTLFDTGNWSVHHEYFVDTGGQACAATVKNSFGDTLDITAWPNGELTLYVLMADDFDGWSGTFQADAIVDVGADRWMLGDSDFRQRTIEFSFESDAQAVSFLTQVHDAEDFSLRSPDGAKAIADWELAGAAQAMARLAECQSRIQPADADGMMS